MPSTGTRVDGLDGFREQLGQDAGRVDPQRQHAGEGAEADGDHEQHGEHHFVDGACAVHQAARRLVDPPGNDVLGTQDPERDRTDDGQNRAPDGDLDGDDHLGEVQRPFMEVGGKEALGEKRHVAGVVDQRHRPHVGPAPGPHEYGENGSPADDAERRAFQVAGWQGNLGRGRRSGRIGHGGYSAFRKLRTRIEPATSG